MLELLAETLCKRRLNPDAFAPIGAHGVFIGEVPFGKVMETWAYLTSDAKVTKYWPIICGDESLEISTTHDPAEILAAAPQGTIREILNGRFLERREAMGQIMPELSAAQTMNELARLSDAAGLNSCGGAEEPEDWPDQPRHGDRVQFSTVKDAGKRPSKILLIPVGHTWHVPAVLGCGGWNDCPYPELQTAVFREWQAEYHAVPACIQGDVIEFAVKNRPQTESQAMKLAAEQWIYCDDIVSQGTQSIRKLAIEIWQSPKWFFWWD